MIIYGSYMIIYGPYMIIWPDMAGGPGAQPPSMAAGPGGAAPRYGRGSGGPEAQPPVAGGPGGAAPRYDREVNLTCFRNLNNWDAFGVWQPKCVKYSIHSLILCERDAHQCHHARTKSLLFFKSKQCVMCFA